CKKALAESGGDLGRAEEILRVRLGNKASRAASRIAAEGVVAAHVAPDGRSGALVEVNCETDFVAKNGEFLAFAAAVAERVAASNPATPEALGDLPLRGATVEETRKALIGRIGENIAIRRFTRMTARGQLVVYIHGGARIGAMADVIGGDDALARDIAMHIAAARPMALAAAAVPAELVEKERAIAAAKAAESGKPAHIAAKMVDGAVQKFFREVTLLAQPFVKDEQQSIEQLLKSKGATVAGFALYVVGEGLEKRKDDFVSEVMAQVGQSA
ncbi:MAG: translation elongation factor Ts, partial [Burkholderiales bacterium]